MHVIKGLRHYWFLSLCSLVLATLLAACGSAANGSSGSSSSGNAGQGNNGRSTSGSASSTAVNSNGTANGCPSNIVVTGQPGKVNITVTARQMHQTITAHNGDIIEIQLPFGHKWTGPTTSQGVLQLQGPAGYASKSANVCVWRFVARGTGTARLMFYGQALCQASQICPMYITAIPFDFSVK
jgi:hypothetical protein